MLPQTKSDGANLMTSSKCFHIGNTSNHINLYCSTYQSFVLKSHRCAIMKQKHERNTKS